MRIVYTIKRSRVGGPIQYPNIGSMLNELRKILEDREKSGFLGKVWLTIEAKKDED